MKVFLQGGLNTQKSIKFDVYKWILHKKVYMIQNGTTEKKIII